MEYPFKDLMPLDEVLEREGYYRDWTHLDPEVFYSLTQISNFIKTKGYGVDVRLLIAQLAEHFGLKTTQVVDLANLLQQKFTNLEGVTQSFTNNINSLVAQMEADKDAVIANATVDSEVILARGGKATLGERLDETTAQLAQMPTVNVKHFGAVGDGVTDDTLSVKAAIAHACSFAKGTGWKSQVPNIIFPAGEYLISEPQALNPTVSALQGFNIVGEGYMNTRIKYTYVGNGPDDYLMLNGGKSWWGFSYVENISFIGNGDNNIWGIKSMSGSPQANRFSRVFFTNIKNCVTVLYGNANANADLFRFEGCKASQINGWVFGIPGSKNSQSINHSFVNCDFESIFGTILYFRSGGDVMVYGGSWIVNTNGRVIDCLDYTSGGIGSGNRFFTFIGTKFEWQGSANRESDETYPLSYSPSLSSIKFIRCNFGQFTDSISVPHTFSFLQRGELIFDDCYIPNNMRVKLSKKDADNNGFNVPHLLVANSHIDVELANFAILDITAGTNNKAWNPIVEAVNCRRSQGNDVTPVDVSLNRQNQAKGLTTNKKMFQYFYGVNYAQGLPKTRQTLKLPIGSTLTKIYLIAGKSTNGSQYTYTIKNFGETKTLLTATFASTPAGNQFISQDLYLHLPNDAEREIIIDVETTATVDRQGYIDFEYI